MISRIVIIRSKGVSRSSSKKYAFAIANLLRTSPSSPCPLKINRSNFWNFKINGTTLIRLSKSISAVGQSGSPGSCMISTFSRQLILISVTSRNRYAMAKFICAALSICNVFKSGMAFRSIIRDVAAQERMVSNGRYCITDAHTSGGNARSSPPPSHDDIAVDITAVGSRSSRVPVPKN